MRVTSIRCFQHSKAERFFPKTGLYPKGFVVGGIHCGVKKKTSLLDLAIIHNVSGNKAVVAACFTKNKFKAAPVQVSAEILKKKSLINSIVINSGNANAVTGNQGLKDAQDMVRVTDAVLENEEDSSLVMSTGVIGNKLPIEKILTGIHELALNNLGSSHEHWMACANAICTTDTFPKLVTKEFTLNGHNYRLAGLVKGAGMICPNMATLLGCIATDAPVTPVALSQILKYAVDRSFNSISVDGDSSTNDTIIAIANGAARGPIIDGNSESTESFEALRTEVTEFAQKLAQLVVRDGEGSTKFIKLVVKDALSYEEAKEVSVTVANSSLFKTAMFGSDANWGRILCAVGYANVSNESVNVKSTGVSFVPSDGSKRLQLLVDGEPQEVDDARAAEILKNEDLEVEIDLGTGGGQEALFWTCDLSYDYIKINADYRS